MSQALATHNEAQYILRWCLVLEITLDMTELFAYDTLTVLQAAKRVALSLHPACFEGRHVCYLPVHHFQWQLDGAIDMKN
jgi:hypothetical protein